MTTLAIHERPGSFSDRWIDRCRDLGVAVDRVDCEAPDIIPRLREVNGLLWHWTHESATDLLMARHVIEATELMGLAVFPNTATCWHFDDKLAQKYLLEAIDAPCPDAKVFYTLDAALAWVARASFPQVFKLRRGAGSANVRLLRNARDARSLARKSFSGGFNPIAGAMHDAVARAARARARADLLGALRRLPATIGKTWRRRHLMARERGYFYVQDFLPGNVFDTRVTIIGDRAFAFTRDVRKNDFRASGSGSIDYDLKRIDMRCVEIAFEVARKTRAQSIAFDFAFDQRRRPLILEVSYAYLAKAVYDCPGRWDPHLEWHEGHVWPQDAILDDILART